MTNLRRILLDIIIFVLFIFLTSPKAIMAILKKIDLF